MYRENEVDGSAYTKRLSVIDVNDAQDTARVHLQGLCASLSKRHV